MATTISRSQVESALVKLRDLPARESERFSRKAAIAGMRSEIQAALDRGYTLEEVAKVLAQTDDGFAGLALSTLRTYLRADRAKAAATTARKNVSKPKTAPQRPPSAPPPAQVSGGLRTNAGLREDI